MRHAFLCTLVSIFSLTISFGQVANDVCSGAITITDVYCSELLELNLGDAQNEADSGDAPCPDCAGGCSNPVNDVWITFTTENDSDLYYDMTIYNVLSESIHLEVYDACGGDLIICASSNPIIGSSSIEFGQLNPEETYYLRIWDSSDDLDIVEVCVSAIYVDFLPLPITLKSFSSRKFNAGIQLDWETTSELNNLGFEIQRSSNGQNAWAKLGFAAGNGTSNSINRYSYIDKTPEQGDNYYRLKQIDTDGQFEYSKVINQDFTSRSNISVYPNPSHNNISISGANGQDYSIQDAFGKIVLTSNQEHLDISNLNSGVYFIQTNDSTFKFFKL